MTQISTNADGIKSDKRYRKYNPWHYVIVKVNETYAKSKKNYKGDIIRAINKCIEILQNLLTNRLEKQFHLKLLIHFVDDIHQPMNLAKPSDLGGILFTSTLG